MIVIRCELVDDDEFFGSDTMQVEIEGLPEVYDGRVIDALELIKQTIDTTIGDMVVNGTGEPW